MGAFVIFLALVALSFAGFRLVMAVRTRPEFRDGSVAFRSGVWIDSWTVSWPLAEVAFDRDQMVVSPRGVRTFAPVTIAREHVIGLRRRWILGTGFRIVAEASPRLTVWPGNVRSFLSKWDEYGWPMPQRRDLGPARTVDGPHEASPTPAYVPGSCYVSWLGVAGVAVVVGTLLLGAAAVAAAEQSNALFALPLLGLLASVAGVVWARAAFVVRVLTDGRLAVANGVRRRVLGPDHHVNARPLAAGWMARVEWDEGWVGVPVFGKRERARWDRFVLPKEHQ